MVIEKLTLEQIHKKFDIVSLDNTISSRMVRSELPFVTYRPTGTKSENVGTVWLNAVIRDMVVDFPYFGAIKTKKDTLLFFFSSTPKLKIKNTEIVMKKLKTEHQPRCTYYLHLPTDKPVRFQCQHVATENEDTDFIVFETNPIDFKNFKIVNE
jgi:hypothetical protein